MANLTLTIITQSLFGEDIAEYSQTMADSVDTMLAVSEKRVWAFPDLHNTFVSPSYWRFRKAKRTLDKMIYTMIERRKTGDNLKPDLLTTMIVASSKHELTYAELSDEITTLIVTGHESTANVLSWFFYEITRHPDILNRIRSEIDCVLGDRKCKMRDLSSLPITKAALQETLRLYPATWTISRTNINQDEVGGVTIPPNSNMMISPYLIHRNKKYWDNADIFNPDRFLSNKADFIPKGAYIPFAMGRRGCIGEKFAWQEMLTIATEIIRKFNFEIIAGQRIEPVAKISTSSINGIWVRPITI
jgi:cytochrome P450